MLGVRAESCLKRTVIDVRSTASAKLEVFLPAAPALALLAMLICSARLAATAQRVPGPVQHAVFNMFQVSHLHRATAMATTPRVSGRGR